MLFSTAAVLLILSRTLTKAHPPDGRDKELTTSGLACLYMTTEPNWQGEGQNICDVPGVCSSDYLPHFIFVPVANDGLQACHFQLD